MMNGIEHDLPSIGKFPINGLRIGLYRGIAFKVVKGRAEHICDWAKKFDNAYGIC